MKRLSSINLNYIAKYLNWRIVDFASEYNLKHQTASRYFKDRDLPIDLAIQLAERLNISLDYIYRYEITDSYLRSKDPGYLQNTIEETGELPKHAQPGMEDLAAKALQQLIDESVKRALKERDNEENSSKTA
ncbi:helix-turn-helix domain-containing protein [Nonlabens xiamenensis]|uniref:helix-turn-helix domain-containing protein n=1 Tax=Nonlabens xiamenensis TaxID=2341043 RepID=UPI000F60BC3E|nr:helix-turn-helix transcriptional regulator [Nonlabens xiamenensis]